MAKPDIYTRITEKIIADLEAGTRPWHKPWSTEHFAGRITRPLRHNGIAYRGLNIILLWAASVAHGYSAPTWMTYRQALELGGQVCKGSKGQLVVYADKLRKTETDDAGQDREVEIPFMKGYTVFNVDQIEGLPEQYYAVAERMPETAERDAAAEAFFAATEADIRHGGNQAFYAVDADYVQMPTFETFESQEAYFATLGHEITHWTRHPKRLDRSFGRKGWGDEGYAQEELVAELGAAFLAADHGLSPEPRDEHASYIGHWLEGLRNDKRFIFQAAAHAQKAVDYLHGLQPNSEEVAA
ncbi:putative ArdC antirestriction protein (plasmid) [Phaeobacter inhibens]|uniref:ArdC antirestriction protein n=1 Tax=Phaeobacter inhibens TaxID=221822 RepID=A0ABM6RKC8_9RHOB|nr:zincin-like metallopeptidase domain-containing protein [Phaeobacter inhibens]AUQ52413.1 putative ArdC antirestriction protein [Phaeobacter inhibens]AUQ97018.1 putative ArdC antirestriction protein [Phaeobacter inhibens]AUR22218.1 putative ArdC antirestriction protein [Phaeobacter inhibens]